VKPVDFDLGDQGENGFHIATRADFAHLDGQDRAGAFGDRVGVELAAAVADEGGSEVAGLRRMAR